MTTKKVTTTKKMKADYREDRDEKTIIMKPDLHLRILNFFNEAVYPEDLVYQKTTAIHEEGDLVHEDNPEEMKVKRNKLMDLKIAEEIIEWRDREYPL